MSILVALQGPAEVNISGAILEGSDACDGALFFIDEEVGEPAGVRRGKRRVIRLTDVKDRQKTADFIKEQLRIVHEDLIAKDVPQSTPPRIKVSQPALEANLTEENSSDDQAAIAAILASIL